MSTDRATALRPARRRRIGYRCAGCGYGIVVAGAVPACPMCGGRDWQDEPWRPFSQLTGDLLPPLRRSGAGSSSGTTTGR